jgi:hypothetical protein
MNEKAKNPRITRRLSRRLNSRLILAAERIPLARRGLLSSGFAARCAERLVPFRDWLELPHILRGCGADRMRGHSGSLTPVRQLCRI